jgi:hypothetical protein
MAGKYVYPTARQFFVRAVFVSTRAISRFARRCSLSLADSAVSGFPGVGALTLKPCSSKSFRRGRQSEIILRSPLPVTARH